jgi:hypothetical protein
MGLFEVLASTDAETQAKLQGKKARVLIAERLKRYDSFLAASQEEISTRVAYVKDDVLEMILGSFHECGLETGGNPDAFLCFAAERFSGGHASDCNCGFCQNKGKLPGTSREEGDRDEEDDEGEEKESSVRRGFDYPSVDGSLETNQADPSGPGGPIGEELSEKKKGDNDDILGGPIGENLSEQKGASVSPRVYPEFPWVHVACCGHEGCDGDCQGCPECKKESSVKTASFCDCDCEGCKDGGSHCESTKCIETKRGEPLPKDKQSRTAADVEDGDTYDQERVDLPKADKSGLSDVGSPKIDKSKVPGGMDGNDTGLSPIDVPSKQHPVEQQDLGVDTPDYWSELPDPSDTGKRVDADTPMQPEHHVAPRTDTWTGTEGQAQAVTSKWIVLPEAK